MSKKLKLPASRRHVQVYDQDWDWLQDNFGRGLRQDGAGPIVREIIHIYVNQLKNKVEGTLDALNKEIGG